jgi:UDP-N-acetylglucosamine--N-acetylmuramyl-(pentapeptide) pyrophosphoryl-undecaprenol N-acetylglucosamine transferase
VHWLGACRGLETHLVPEANFPLHKISVVGMRGKGMRALLMAPVNIMFATVQSLRVIKLVQPDIVIGMGGFVSGPGGVASWLLRCPLIIHEQNAKAGLTNKLLAYLAKKVLQGFPTAFASHIKVSTTGNPVRAEIISLPPPKKRLNITRKPFRLLVLGGSLGALALNEVVPDALAKLTPEQRPDVWHQCGEKYFLLAKKKYKSIGITANIEPFINNMAQAYAWADVVLCRAGALTIAELCTVGLGAIFVPYPHAVDDHQTANANLMVQKQAALCIQQVDLTDTRLAEVVKQFAVMPAKYLAMAQAAYALRRIDVTEKIFRICEEVCH